MSHRESGECPPDDRAGEAARLLSRKRWKEPPRGPLTQAQVDLLMQLLRQSRPRRFGRP